jgi:hypothetical protein
MATSAFRGAAVVLFACGGGGSPHDAGVCSARASYGSAAIVSSGSAYAFTAAEIAADGSAGIVDANQGYSGAIDADALPDFFELDLYEGFGAFAGGAITSGTFTLAGSDLSYQSCGLCVQIYTDLGSDGAPADLYFATGGTVELASVGTPTGSDVSTGTLAGVVTDVTFARWNGSNDVPIGDCTSSIASLGFSGTLEPVVR